MDNNIALDLAVIGAGIYGIQAAKTYLEIHPDHEVLVFEASGSIGGVWSRERMYDAFWTQTTLGIAEFSDLPLKGVPKSETYYGFFPARYLTEYLEEYVRTRQYASSSLQSCILLSTKVSKLIKLDSGWRLEVESKDNTRKWYSASKVIDATGLTSAPNMPSIAGMELFHGDIIHHKDFGSIQEKLQSNDQWQNVIVIGGAKSAADIAYACAKAGKTVNWIIRRSGAGPAAYAGAKGSGFYANSNESFYTRLTSYFLASTFLDESASVLGRFLYQTRLGQWLFETIWNRIDAKVRGLADYDREDGVANGFCNLKPDTSLFWQNDSTGICQRDDFFDVIAQKVKVHRQDIDKIKESGICLTDRLEIEADVILCGTGWKTSHPKIVDQKDAPIEQRLGLANASQASKVPSQQHWEKLEAEARGKIHKRFPVLNKPPIKVEPLPESSPLRLFKGILPVEDRTIAFLGQMLLGNNFRVAEVQALFAVAALDGKLGLPSKDEIEADIAYTIAWNRCRYLKKGQQGMWLYWDMVPYTDHLLDCMGLRSHRHQTILKDLFSTCFAQDLKGLIREYKDKNDIAAS